MQFTVSSKIINVLSLSFIFMLHTTSKPIESPLVSSLRLNPPNFVPSSSSSAPPLATQSPNTLLPPSSSSSSSSPLIKRITSRLLTSCPISHPHLYRSTCAYSSFHSALSPRAYTIQCYQMYHGPSVMFFTILVPGECAQDEICVDGLMGAGPGPGPGPVASCVKMEDLIRFVGVLGKWVGDGGGEVEEQGQGEMTVSTSTLSLPPSISPATSQKYSITVLLTTLDNQTLLSASSLAIHPQRQVKTGANSMAWYDLPVISARSMSVSDKENSTTNVTIPIRSTTNLHLRNPNPPDTPFPPPSSLKESLPIPSAPSACTTCAEVRLASIPPGTQRVRVDVKLLEAMDSGVAWVFGGRG